MKKIVFVVEKTNTGYSAYADNFERFPVSTTGDNVSELRKNILDAVNLYFDEVDQKHVKDDDIQINFDLPQFFEFYKVINAKGLAERIGLSRSLLSQYITGVKKPSPKQAQKILEGVRQLGKELSQIEFI